MEPQTLDAEPRLLDTYALTYAYTALLLVPGLLLIDNLSIAEWSPPYLALIAGPFLLGPALVFLTDSKDGARTVLIRTAILAPLVALSGITVVLGAMLVVLIPLSLVLAEENFEVLAVLSAVTIVVLAAPLVISLVRRARVRPSAMGVFQMVALLICIVIVAWTVVMTFDSGHTLATFLRRDLADHYAGTFTWYLPALGLAAGVWRGIGLV